MDAGRRSLRVLSLPQHVLPAHHHGIPPVRNLHESRQRFCSGRPEYREHTGRECQHDLKIGTVFPAQ